jgi:glycine/D-amino acid oxidase-like deaminating enzyme
MIATSYTPPQFKDALPDAVDVVVIGGGIAGISTAWSLREAGLSVLVCEKGVVAGEQSSRNWGWIRQQGRDADELPIMMESMCLWQSMSEQLDADVGFARHGVLYLAETLEQLESHHNWLDIAQQHQLDSRMLSAAEVDQLFDSRPGQWLGGLFTPSDARAEPFKAVPAMARALQRRGGHLRENCAVRSLDVSAGRVSGVVTELGRVRADSVVCCGGAWSGMLLANHDISLPQLTVRATVARTAPAVNIGEAGVSAGGVGLRRRRDGGYTLAASNTNDHYVSADSFRYLKKFLPALQTSKGSIQLRFDDGLLNRLLTPRHWSSDAPSPFESARVLNPAPSPEAVAKIRRVLAERVPKLADVEFLEAWGGMIDVMPDVVPVMDEVVQLPGLFVATGFSGHGFGIGPGAGKIMADLVRGRPPGHDLRRFRLSRFSDGSRMRPGPGL